MIENYLDKIKQRLNVVAVSYTHLGLMLDRMSLSIRNGWLDDDNLSLIHIYAEIGYCDHFIILNTKIPLDYSTFLVKKKGCFCYFSMILLCCGKAVADAGKIFPGKKRMCTPWN